MYYMYKFVISTNDTISSTLVLLMTPLIVVVLFVPKWLE